MILGLPDKPIVGSPVHPFWLIGKKLTIGITPQLLDNLSAFSSGPVCPVFCLA